MTRLRVKVVKLLPAPPNIMGTTFISPQNECKTNMGVVLMVFSLVCGCYPVALCLLVISHTGSFHSTPRNTPHRWCRRNFGLA